MRHGLLANVVLLSNEDDSVFRSLFDMHVARFSPLDDIEMSMIAELTAATWRLHRAMAMEKQILESGITAGPEGSPIEQITSAWCDPENQLNLTRLQRYETRLQNMYQRALRGLALLRKMPPAPPNPACPDAIAPLPNEPKEPNLCNSQDPPPPLRPEPAPLLQPLPAATGAAETKILPFAPLISS
jgi:hypothetical protein